MRIVTRHEHSETTTFCCSDRELEILQKAISYYEDQAACEYVPEEMTDDYFNEIRDLSDAMACYVFGDGGGGAP